MKRSLFVSFCSALSISCVSFSSLVYAGEPQPEGTKLPAVGKTSEALDGRITDLRTNPFENQVLAYQSLREVAQEIRKNIRDRKLKVTRLIIYDEASFRDLALYQTYSHIQRRLNAAYKKALASPPPAPDPNEGADLTGLAIPTNVLRTAIEFIALFRSDTELKDAGDLSSVATTQALVTQLASNPSELGTERLTVFYPGVYALDQGKSIEEVTNGVQTIMQKKRDATRVLDNANLDSAKRAELEELNKKADELIALLSAPPKSSDASPSKAGEATSAHQATDSIDLYRSLARGKRINDYLAQDDTTYVLRVETKASGTIQNKRSLFSTRIRHSGGVLVNYMLFNPAGEIKLANTIYHHSGFVKIDGVITNIEKK